jgi:hypothetical protein
MTGFQHDCDVTIGDKTYPVRLTLGALAEIEEALETRDLAQLAGRLANPAATDLLIILAALLRAGGSTISVEQLKKEELNLPEVIKTIVNAFSAIMTQERASTAGK